MFKNLLKPGLWKAILKISVLFNKIALVWDEIFSLSQEKEPVFQRRNMLSQNQNMLFEHLEENSILEIFFFPIFRITSTFKAKRKKFPSHQCDHKKQEKHQLYQH